MYSQRVRSRLIQYYNVWLVHGQHRSLAIAQRVRTLYACANVWLLQFGVRVCRRRRRGSALECSQRRAQQGRPTQNVRLGRYVSAGRPFAAVSSPECWVLSTIWFGAGVQVPQIIHLSLCEHTGLDYKSAREPPSSSVVIIGTFLCCVRRTLRVMRQQQRWHLIMSLGCAGSFAKPTYFGLIM